MVEKVQKSPLGGLKNTENAIVSSASPIDPTRVKYLNSVHLCSVTTPPHT